MASHGVRGQNNLLLSEADINQVTAYASQLGVPSENLWIRNFERLEGGGPGTAYGSDFDLLNVGLNVKPAPVLGNAFSQISIPGAGSRDRRPPGSRTSRNGLFEIDAVGSCALDEAQRITEQRCSRASLTEGERAVLMQAASDELTPFNLQLSDVEQHFYQETGQWGDWSTLAVRG